MLPNFPSKVKELILLDKSDKAKVRNPVIWKKMRLCGIFSTTIGREEELLLDEETGDAEGPKGKADAKVEEH